MPGPMDGVKIIDVSAIVSGPLAAMMLADQGADVIKVEAPGLGDLMRAGAFARGGLTAFFANANRGKRGMVINMAEESGQALVRELVRDADVFIENYRPGALARLGLGYEDLKKINPDLIYCTVNGFGDTGPYANRRIYDPIIQAMSGHVAVQKNPDVPIPDLIRNIVVDKASAYTAAQAISAALFARERGAGGQYIQVPMLDASLAFFWCDGMMAQTFVGEGIERPGPCLYEVYRLTETADGHLVLFTASESEWHGLFRAIGKPEFCTDEKWATGTRLAHLEELGAILYNEMRKFPTKEILARLIEEDVPAGPVLQLEEIFDDPQVVHNEAIFEVDHPTAGRMRQARPAARFSGTSHGPGRMPPLHGEHTDEVLGEMGYDAAAIAAMRRAGIVC